MKNVAEVNFDLCIELAALREENERLKSESFEELYNAAIDERDALREELISAQRGLANCKLALDAQTHNYGVTNLRLTAAEQRNAELETLLEKNENLLDALNCSGLMQFVRPELAASIRSCVREAQSRALRAALKPTESGASE